MLVGLAASWRHWDGYSARELASLGWRRVAELRLQQSQSRALAASAARECLQPLQLTVPPRLPKAEHADHLNLVARRESKFLAAANRELSSDVDVNERAFETTASRALENA